MVRYLLSLLTVTTLVACGSSQQTDELHSLRNEMAQSRVAQDAMTAEINDMRARRHPPAGGGQPAPAPTVETADKPADAPTPPGSSGERCWQGYCPCRDRAPISQQLCRDIRGGQNVSDDTLMAAKAQRDAERILGSLGTD